MATKFAKLESVYYSIWGILQERVYRSRIHDVKELKERQLREWRLLDHTVIVTGLSLNDATRQ